MEYDSDYILIMEDDAFPSNHALDKAYSFMEEQFSHQKEHSLADKLGFVTLFSALNHIGKGPAIETNFDSAQLGGSLSLMYRSEDVPGMIEYLKKDPFEHPIDYAIIQYFYVERRKRQFVRVPNLFQHVCQHSTYTDEVTHLFIY